MTSTVKALLFLILISLFSCNLKPKKTAMDEKEKKEMTIAKEEPSKTEVLVAETIAAHGGERYNNAHYNFTFRTKKYTFKNDNNSFRYSVKSVKEGDSIVDVLENGTLSRTVNNNLVSLSEKDKAIHTEALNSVVYFATLPHKLKDQAVNKTYEGQAMVKGKKYDLLGISFDREGGGKDYDDKFLYWINTTTNFIDYLAYSYSTNDGGVRFRSTFNPRTVAGIRFQDYINYEVPIGTPLKELSGLYEKGTLKELSKIITEDVRPIE